jgi:hypothetical protein
MNRFDYASPTELIAPNRVGVTASFQRVLRKANQRRWLPFKGTASVTRRLYVAVATTALVLSSFVVIHPAMAQLRGDWPTDVHLTRVSDANVPHADRFDVHANDARAEVPRGDLRKDVADAARTETRRPAR